MLASKGTEGRKPNTFGEHLMEERDKEININERTRDVYGRESTKYFFFVVLEGIACKKGEF